MSSDTKYGRKIAPCVDRFPSTRTENSVNVVFFCVRGGRKLASGLLTFPSLQTENNTERDGHTSIAGYLPKIMNICYNTAHSPYRMFSELI